MFFRNEGGRNFLRSDEGGVFIMVGLIMPILAALMGGAVEYNLALHHRQDLQSSADAAALAGAKFALRSASEAHAVATRAFYINYGSSGRKVVPTVAVDGGRVTVAARDNIKTPLMSFAQVGNLNFDVKAVAEAGAVQPAPVCVLLMDEALVQSFNVIGSNTIDAPDCEIHVRSKDVAAALIHTNTDYDVRRTCIAGNFEFRGGVKKVIDRIWGDCETADDPYAGRLPLPASGQCIKMPSRLDVHVVLEPGTYCGDWKFNGSVKFITLKPGVYVFNNADFRFNGELDARDVTIFLADKDSTIRPIGDAIYTLTAPRTGMYAGIALFEAPDITEKSTWRMTGNADSHIEGIVHLPSRNLKWSGSASGSRLRVNLVLNSMKLFGNTLLNIQPYDLQRIYADPHSYTHPNVVALQLID